MNGTVIRRGKSWSVVLDLGRDAGGRRVRKWHSGFRTRKEAERARVELLHKVQEGSYVNPSKLTVDIFLKEQWLPVIRASVRPATLSSYRGLVEHHISPTIGAVALQKLTPATLNAVYADLLDHGRSDGRGGLSPKTVRNIHVVIRKALGDAVKWNLLPRNVAQLAEPPRLTNSGRKELATWTADQLRSFLATVKDSRLYPAFHLAASTGMRRGEILGLRWKDVDFERSTLSVRQTLISVDYEAQFSTPKTKRSRRAVALDAATVTALRTHRKAQTEEKLAIGAPRYTDQHLVFCKVDGSPLHPDLFSQSFDRAVARADVTRIRFHDLRHTHATLALQAGVHPKVVSDRLGHASVAFTLDVYSHAVPAMQADAAEIVAAMIRGGQS